MSKSDPAIPEVAQTSAVRQTALMGLLLMTVCAAVVVVHLPVLSAGALSFDDGQYLIDNVLVCNPGWASVRRFLGEVLEPSSVGGYYQPLAMISLMIDYALGGRPDNLLSFHRTSLLIHVANTALIIVLLYVLFGDPWAAAGVGLLFGVHPMTVESVAWVADRKTLLAAFFALWALVFYVYYVRCKGRALYVGCILLYVLALGSKPTSISLPALMLLMDCWPLRRLDWRAVIEKLPLFAVGGVFAIVIFISQSRTAGVRLPSEHPIGETLLTICHDAVFYLYKVVWPASPPSYHAFPDPMSLANPLLVLSVIASGILVGLLALSTRWTRAFLVGYGIFFLAILPTMQVVGFSFVIASDKFAYLPSVGLLMILGWLIHWVRVQAVGRCSRLIAVNAALVICALVAAVGEISITRSCLGCWRDSVCLYEHMLTKAPAAPELHASLSAVLESEGRFSESIYHARRAVEILPSSSYAQTCLGLAMVKMGRPQEGVSHLREAIRLERDDLGALRNLAWYRATHPDPNVRNADESLACAKRLVHLTGHRCAGALDVLSVAWATNGEFEQAIATARKALWVTSMTGENELADRITQRLAFYVREKPYREDPVAAEMEPWGESSSE